MPIKKYVLLAGENDNQSKRFGYQSSKDALNDYFQRYIIEYLEIVGNN